MNSKKLRMPEISRALAKHEPNTVYTLLREVIPSGQAGDILLELIRSQPGWPIEEEITYDQRLTPRELDILRYADQGLSTTETAHEIPLGYQTVKTHRQHIYTKLGVTTILEAVHKGHELGLL